eukprot:CAMPEP_0184317040 /NCGR_PEP_ID=MMETSP1049-20130417/94087_1 /TAXON_ID=77928 /ORGANISM="Proteomonas sulcata, Strain CCMP704" /LENGTH=83 /DNA_ID=CAMNT_0026636265 /DNA_START=400 /DNA_END=651 /DNA_ORIENTATION=-
MTPECDSFYSDKYSDLLLLFQVLVVTMVVGFLLSVCSMLVLVGALGVALAGKNDTPKYDEIPDSLENPRDPQASGLPPTEGFV